MNGWLSLEPRPPKSVPVCGEGSAGNTDMDEQRGESRANEAPVQSPDPSTLVKEAREAIDRARRLVRRRMLEAIRASQAEERSSSL